HIVLQMLQLREDIPGNDIGPGAQDLSQLDEGGAQLLQGLPQTNAAAAGALSPFHGQYSPPEREHVMEVQLLDKITKAMAQKDLHDLAIAAQLPVAPVHQLDGHPE